MHTHTCLTILMYKHIHPLLREHTLAAERARTGAGAMYHSHKPETTPRDERCTTPTARELTDPLAAGLPPLVHPLIRAHTHPHALCNIHTRTRTSNRTHTHTHQRGLRRLEPLTTPLCRRLLRVAPPSSPRRPLDGEGQRGAPSDVGWSDHWLSAPCAASSRGEDVPNRRRRNSSTVLPSCALEGLRRRASATPP